LRGQLERLLDARVDLVSADSLKDSVRQNVLTDTVSLVSRPNRARLEDIAAAIEAIDAHLQRGDLSTRVELH
jgi:hypothetical protein